MIKRKDLLTFHFYKKETFTGSYQGMRYRIQKAKEGEADLFSVATWPGPYCFAATEEEKITTKTFPFQENSLQEITDYLNAVYQQGRESWPDGVSVHAAGEGGRYADQKPCD